MELRFTAEYISTEPSPVFEHGKTYEMITCDFEHYLVFSKRNVFIDAIDMTLFSTAFKINPGIDIPAMFLSPKAADDIYRSEWSNHVCADVEGMLEDYAYEAESLDFTAYCEHNNLQPEPLDEQENGFVLICRHLESGNRYVAITDDDMTSIIKNVAYKYAYEGEYDCNIDYWSQLEELINDEIKNILIDIKTN